MSQEATVPVNPDYQEHAINSGSYGAAFFNWIYLLAMRSYGHAAIAFLGSLIAWPIVMIVYGIYGKRIAWRSRPWRNFDDFLACQRVWTSWAVWWTVIVVGFIVLAIMLPAFLKGHSTSI